VLRGAAATGAPCLPATGARTLPACLQSDVPTSWSSVVAPCQPLAAARQVLSSSVAARTPHADVGESQAGPGDTQGAQEEPGVCVEVEAVAGISWQQLGKRRFLGVLINADLLLAGNRGGSCPQPGSAQAASAAGDQGGAPAATMAGARPSSPGGTHAGSPAGSQSGVAAGLVHQLRQLPMQQLCPKGFLFIWAHKENLAGAGPARSLCRGAG